MKVPRLDVSARMRSLMAYDKMAAPAPRVLILESRYWLDGACANAAQKLVWEVETAPVATEGLMPREWIAGLLHALAEFKPDFILTVNLSGMDMDGLLARLFEDLQIPYVTWFVDDPRTIIMGRNTYASSLAVALTWDETYLAYLEAQGFAQAHHMPLAVDDTVFNAEPADSWDHPPSFVGNSMVHFAEREWAWFEDYPELASAVRDAFDERKVTRENFGKGIECVIDGAARLDSEARRHVELYLFVEGTRRLRHELVRMFAAEGLVVRGDDGWRNIVANAGGPVRYAEDLPRFYRECELNLNITSIQMPRAVNQRVFDCPAAGGFLLTDCQPALEDLFDPEHEVAAYSSLEECRDLYRYYRKNAKARKEITARARKRILGEHTYAHRLRRIAEIVKAAFGT